MHIACCTIVQFVVVCCHRQSCALLFFWAYINLTPSAISIRSMAPGTRRNDQLKCVQQKLFLQCSRADFPQEYSKHDIAMKKKRVENTSDCMTFARHEISHFEVSGATIFFFWAWSYFMEDLSILSPNFKHLPYLYLPSAISGTRWDCIYLVNQKLFNGKL